MSFDTGRRGLFSRGALALALPLLGGSVAAAARKYDPASPDRAGVGAADVDFATWNRINNLVHTYADCMDRLDMNGLGAIFLPAAIYDYKPGMVMHGREALKAGFLKTLGAYQRTWHMMSAPTVKRGERPGTYEGTTYFVARHEHRDGGFHAVYGRYADRYEPDTVTGELLIANRKVIAQMSEGDVGDRYWLPRPS